MFLEAKAQVLTHIAQKKALPVNIKKHGRAHGFAHNELSSITAVYYPRLNDACCRDMGVYCHCR